MLRLVCLLAVLGCAFAGVVPDWAAYLPNGRIVGGTSTTVQTYPHQISLQRNGRHSCGGSLISKFTVVTAAHCLQNIQASDLAVRVGSSLHRSGGVVHQVASFKNHENYITATRGFDVAIIILAQPVAFNDFAQPIPLAKKTPAPGTKVIASGWGTTVQGSRTLPAVLQQVELNAVSGANCNKAYSPTVITDTMICAESLYKDSCQGDSGGPLIANKQLVGVVSWGYGCAQPGYPGVYADVPSLLEWINANRKD